MKKIFSTSFSHTILHFWLLILRIGVSGFMLTHGFPKAMRVMDGNMQFGDPFGLGASTSLILAVFAEVVCSIFLIFGFATRLVVLPLIITMGTAAFLIHADDPFGKQELPLLYLLIYITILILGSGRYSIDQTLGKKGR